MKQIFQINRYESSAHTAHMIGGFPKTDHNYRAVTFDDVSNRITGDGTPPFHAISRDYFACEAHHHFASEAVVFCLLTMATVLPLLNAASSVVGLIYSSGGPL